MDITPKQFSALLAELKGIRSHLRILELGLDDIRNEHARHNQQTEADETQKQQHPIQIGGEVRATVQETRAAESEKRSYNNKTFWLQVLLTAGTWLAFVAAAIYAGIAALQLSASQDAVVQATRSANEARTANTGAQDRFIADQRPIVWPTSADLPQLSVGQKAAWTFNYADYGKSPALGVAVNAKVVFGDPAKRHWRLNEKFSATCINRTVNMSAWFCHQPV